MAWKAHRRKQHEPQFMPTRARHASCCTPRNYFPLLTAVVHTSNANSVHTPQPLDLREFTSAKLPHKFHHRWLICYHQHKWLAATAAHRTRPHTAAQPWIRPRTIHACISHTCGKLGAVSSLRLVLKGRCSVQSKAGSQGKARRSCKAGESEKVHSLPGVTVQLIMVSTPPCISHTLHIQRTTQQADCRRDKPGGCGTWWGCRR
jgi:hypothetical protein